MNRFGLGRRQDTRKSQTSVHLEADGCCLNGITCRQDVISLSSCEAECHAGARGISEAFGAKSIFEFLGYHVVMRWRCDNQSARQLARQEGTGRNRHLAAKILWIQDLVKRKELLIEAVPGADNKSDLGTKILPRTRLEWLR